MLWKLLVDMKAAADADPSGGRSSTIRREDLPQRLYPEYKAHRPPAPEDLVPQFPLVREATKAFGVPCIELPGYEADDLIAAYACHVRERGEVVIVSSDKDLMQLVGERVSMFDPMKNIRLGPRRGGREVRRAAREGGRCPGALRRIVDNVPGAPGIGIKTAAR